MHSCRMAVSGCAARNGLHFRLDECHAFDGAINNQLVVDVTLEVGVKHCVGP